uniref:Uncharacterized protein n=1 Tax=Meloidogyne incognita TaxID=6306 RepID=A0A914NIG0_MELIC
MVLGAVMLTIKLVVGNEPFLVGRRHFKLKALVLFRTIGMLLPFQSLVILFLNIGLQKQRLVRQPKEYKNILFIQHTNMEENYNYFQQM